MNNHLVVIFSVFILIALVFFKYYYLGLIYFLFQF